MGKTDSKTLDLIKEVQKQKAEIAKAEKPNWKTNCSFPVPSSIFEEDTARTISLHVEANIKKLLDIAAFLKNKKFSYEDIAHDLEVDAPSFTWAGYPLEDWLSDIKSRIAKIQIATKRKKLEVFENRLNSIISPELRAEMELEAIASELK